MSTDDDPPAPDVSDTRDVPEHTPTPLKRGRHRRRRGDLRPSDRDVEIYYRHRVCLETTRALAAQFGLTPQRIWQIAKRTSAWYLAQHVVDDETIRREQTIQLRWMAEEAAEQWRSSKQPQTITLQTTTGDGKKNVSLRSASRHGDARLLDTMRNCLKDIRDIWGLDAPPRAHASHPGAFMSREAIVARLRERMRELGIQLSTDTTDVPPRSVATSLSEPQATPPSIPPSIPPAANAE